MPVTLWSSTSSNSISVPPKLKVYQWICLRSSTCVQTRKITYTNSRFQISSYHDVEATQIKYQVWCAISEAWSLCGIRLHPLLTQASTQNSTRLTGKLWHAKGTMTLLPLSVTPPFEVASETSATQMWRGTRRGNTDSNRNLLFAWALKEISARFVLD